jgi:hypothetical protein
MLFVQSSTADSSNEQRRVCTKCFFVSVTSRGWRGLSRTRQILWRNFEKTSKELWSNFEGTLKETSKFFGETLFNFFHSSDFLRSILLIGEFQIFVVEYSNIRTYLNYSNFPTAPYFSETVGNFLKVNLQKSSFGGNFLIWLTDRLFFFSALPGLPVQSMQIRQERANGSMSQMTVKTWRYHSNVLFLRPSGRHAISCRCI